MASHFCSLQQRNLWPESPAKAFAKLKQKVQTETKWRTEEPPTASSRPRDAGSELSDHLQLGSSHSEAQALTLSPTSSPPTSEEETPEGPSEARRGHTLRAFLESTAVSNPFLVNPPQIRDFKGCNASTIHEQSVCAEDSVFTPTKPRLRKRVQRLRPQSHTMRKAPDVSQKHSSSNTSSLQLTAEQPERPEPPPPTVSTQKCYSFGLDPHLAASPAQRYISRTYVLNGGELDQFPRRQAEKVDIRNASECVTDESARGQSESDLSGESSLRADPPQPALCREDGPISNRYPVRVVQNALMSPAKVFALMKDRENKVEPQKVPHHIRRNLNNADDVQLRDASLSTSQSVGETEASSERVSAEVLSGVEHSEEMVQIPAAAAPPLTTLLQDPLLLKSPKVLIPKRQRAASKSNWPSHAKFPSENVIYLKKWCLRKLTKGLYVEGIHWSENIRWNSNIIVERISKSVLKTASGRTYILVGKMMKCSSDFPQWLQKKFVNGFPSNWKGLYEKFQSESRKGKRKSGDGTNNAAKKKPEASTEKTVRKKPSTPPGDPSPPFGSAKLSRSGRLVIPPLDYWRGGRVILDAYKNVTIHECYETSIVIPNDPTTQPACPSQAPGGKDGSAPGAPTRRPQAKNPPAINSNPAPGATAKQSKSSKQESAPLQRPQVSAGQRRKANALEKPEAPMETQSRSTRFSKNRLASEKELQMKNDPQQQSRAEKSSAQTSTRQTSGNITTATSRTRRKNQKSPEPPAGDLDEASQMTRSLRSRVRSTSPPDLESSEEGEKEPRKKRNQAQIKAKRAGSKRPGASGPAQPLQRSTQSSQKQKAKQAKAATRQDPDEDKWTEEELQKLHEAVSYFPRHILGYWERVARMVETRSAEECHNQHTSMETSQQQPKKARRKKAEAPKSADVPLISARAGTLKRKQQVRQFLEAVPREDVDDAFSSAYMQNKRFELHSLGPNDDSDIMLSELEPLTPRSACFPEVKTPQCLHITPGMMGSPNRSNDDKYVYQLQKRMKKSRFDVQKRSRLLKKFTPTPSVKKPLRRCENTGNDSFVVWEMFSGKDAASPDSEEEEEDFYFSDSN